MRLDRRGQHRRSRLGRETRRAARFHDDGAEELGESGGPAPRQVGVVREPGRLCCGDGRPVSDRELRPAGCSAVDLAVDLRPRRLTLAQRHPHDTVDAGCGESGHDGIDAGAVAPRRSRCSPPRRPRRWPSSGPSCRDGLEDTRRRAVVAAPGGELPARLGLEPEVEALGERVSLVRAPVEGVTDRIGDHRHARRRPGGASAASASSEPAPSESAATPAATTNALRTPDGLRTGTPYPGPTGSARRPVRLTCGRCRTSSLAAARSQPWQARARAPCAYPADR